jgi:hypothetical protein
MSALSESVDLQAALLKVKETGAALIPDALHDPFGTRLQSEVESGAFAPVPERSGKVTQEVDSFIARGASVEAFPLIAEFMHELTNGVKFEGRGIKGVTTWKPNLVVVQRFKSGTLGITPHLDGKRFAKLVAILTTKGGARFTVCKNRKGDVVDQWEAEAGSLILLRAPGFAGAEDGRPFHMVEGPKRGQRYSVAFRMDTK